MSVSRSLRFQILRRDQHKCRYCGRSAPEIKLTVDHVVPETLGGRSEPENLVTACEPCNGGKAATPPDAALVADVAEDALRWAAARQFASELIDADRESRDRVRAVFLDTWNDWTYRDAAGDKQTLELPNCWPLSVDRLVQAGLDAGDLAEAVDVAMRTERVKDIFKYFCGVAWGMARQLDEKTREVIDGNHEPEETYRSHEGRVSSCRVGCPECSRVFEIFVEILEDQLGEPLKVRAEPVGTDPFGPGASLRPPESIKTVMEQLFSGRQP